jgi:hypothetical protein
MPAENSPASNFKKCSNRMASKLVPLPSPIHKQANAELECAYQTIANQIRTIDLLSLDLTTLSDVQDNIVAPVRRALNSTYHTSLDATPGQLAYGRDMIMPTRYLANWHTIRQRRQAVTDKNNAVENRNRIVHRYSVGDRVLLLHDRIQGKLAKPTLVPFEVTNVTNQHVNGTITIRRRPRLRPFRAVEDANEMTGSPNDG